jgi:hypothetical protein
MPQPRHADPVPYGVAGNAFAQGRYRARDHVARRDVLTVHRQIALADMQVGAADGAGQDPGPAARREPGPAQASPRTSAGRSRSVLAGSPPRPASFPGYPPSFLTSIIVRDQAGRRPAPTRGQSIRFVLVARAGRAGESAPTLIAGRPLVQLGRDVGAVTVIDGEVGDGRSWHRRAVDVRQARAVPLPPARRSAMPGHQRTAKGSTTRAADALDPSTPPAVHSQFLLQL